MNTFLFGSSQSFRAPEKISKLLTSRTVQIRTIEISVTFLFVHRTDQRDNARPC